MAKEDTSEQAWHTWYHSGEPELRALADEMFPVLSLREERWQILMNKDIKKGIYMGKVFRKHMNAKDQFSSHQSALQALIELRNYRPETA
jgi:hypothetical protein